MESQTKIVESSTDKIGKFWIHCGLGALVFGMIFGLIGSLAYSKSYAEVLKWIPFQSLRPLHVSFVIGWIFMAAIGGVFIYLPGIVKREWFSVKAILAHTLLYGSAFLLIMFCQFLGWFGGREYLEYPPVLGVLVLGGWLFTLFNFFKTTGFSFSKYPVYVWMWGTGFIAFAYTYIESYLWMIPEVGNNPVRDVAIQWKALGAMVGSWNMLVYGTGIFLMSKIKKDSTIGFSKTSFLFYFLGLTNLMFNWGHHTYIVPASHYVKMISYAISMTEWILIGNMILQWRKTLSKSELLNYDFSVRFMTSADIWIFLNLVLAVLMSIPYINLFTHGTHITVAHSMGTTIGINTSILFASLAYIFRDRVDVNRKSIRVGFWLFNSSLAVFWVSIIVSGWIKGAQPNYPFEQNHAVWMNTIRSYYSIVGLSGLGIFVGILLVIYAFLFDSKANKKLPAA